MQIEILKDLFKKYKEPTLFNRYIHNDHIDPLLKRLNFKCQVEVIGQSVKGENIHSIKLGSGDKKILMWSQMHGNESTTTKAVFDLINLLVGGGQVSTEILRDCTVLIIPILNPDGAKAYTRLNANQVDLNRDAQSLTQPESLVLRACFDDFKPDFCFNLHGQRTIFGAGNKGKVATVSFLAPTQDEKRTITTSRKRAMEVISQMNTVLQDQIPGQVGVYDDGFNLDCVGDTFQSLDVSTILFEAGHYPDDYTREQVREFMFQSLLVSLDYISVNDVKGGGYMSYLEIPKNEKCFFDIIIRNVEVEEVGGWSVLKDVAIQYEERLKEGLVEFIPKVEMFTEQGRCFAHKNFEAHGNKVFTVDNMPIFEGYIAEFVLLNNDELSLKLT